MRFLLILALAGSLVLSGCGDSDGTSGGEGSGDTEKNVAQVGVTEFSFDMDSAITGGPVTLELTNNGGLPHEAAFGEITGGHTLEDVMKALESQKQPSWFKDLAGVPVIEPGSTVSMSRELDPGRYIFLCFFPVPGSGAPHVTKGMVKVFDAKGTSDAEAPQPDLAITATDDGFDVPEVPAGEQAVEFANEGTKPHEFSIYSLEPGKTEKDIGKWFQSGFQSEKPAVFPGGLQSIDPGTSVIVEMTFESGRTYTIEDFESKLSAEFEVQ